MRGSRLPRLHCRRLHLDRLPLPLRAHMDAIRPALRPPVANQLLFARSDMKVMAVGGPNRREDFHVNRGEELFLQLEGDMVLSLAVAGARRDVVVREGEMFLLPGGIPHSPQRKADTIGLVFERARSPSELDSLRWYVPGSFEKVLYEESFHCTDLGSQLKPVIDRYFDSAAYASKVPDRAYSAVVYTAGGDELPPPFPLARAIEAAASSSARSTSSAMSRLVDAEFCVDSLSGRADERVDTLEAFGASEEVFCWQRSGFSTVESDGSSHALEEGSAYILRLGQGTSRSRSIRIVQEREEDNLVLVSNKNLHGVPAS